MRRLFFLLPAFAVLLLDQASKIWCMKNLQENFPVPFVDHLLYLTLTYNARGAFSLFPFSNGVFIVTTVLLLGVAFYYAVAFSHPYDAQIFLGMLIGGGAGNLIDRIRLGYVVDFLDLRYWPVFNVADSSISVSITVLVVYLLLKPSRRNPQNGFPTPNSGRGKP